MIKMNMTDAVVNVSQFTTDFWVDIISTACSNVSDVLSVLHIMYKLHQILLTHCFYYAKSHKI